MGHLLGIQLLVANNSLMKNCDDLETAEHLMTRVLYFSDTMRKAWLQSCPIPCTQITHHLTTALFHQNINMNQENVKNYRNSGFIFSMNYDSFTMETTVETLRYDLVDFLTQAGGNLGLFLGFSCFSILISGIDLLRIFIRK